MWVSGSLVFCKLLHDVVFYRKSLRFPEAKITLTNSVRVGGVCGKTRLVPLHDSTCQVLADYIERRQRHWAGRPVSAYLFVSSWGNRLDGAQIHRAFYRLSRQIGLRGVSDRHGPRLHDLRHRFATHTLVNWYRCDQKPERRLPLLSAYLGHVHVADTQWYLEASPELMHEAMCRLEQSWEDRA